MKKYLLKIILFTLTVSLLCGCMCSCSKGSKKTATKKYNNPDISSLASGEYFENQNYTLIWDDEKKSVLLEDKINATFWSSIPYSYYQEEDPSGIGMVRMHSPIYIEFLSGQEIKTAYAKVEAVNNGYVIATEIKNGFRVTYYMPNIEISVPVDYVLCDRGLKVSLAISDVCENENLLYSVSVSPFMCSVKNGTEDSYIFIPSGSGSLMYVDEGGRNSRTFHDLVYGTDFATTINEKTVNKENITMPVFGVKENNRGMCAIITEGAEMAQINAEVGNEEYGYSAVWATFLVRGVNSLYVKDYQGNQGQISISSNDAVNLKNASVLYTPLPPDKASYIGMAEVYREYLKSSYKIQDITTKDYSSVYLQFLGGTVAKDTRFGFKNDRLLVSTTYEDVEKIVEQISDKTGEKPVIQMLGFSKNGIDIGEIGGLSLSKKFGNYSDFNNYCNNSNLSCYFDFDVLNYSKSGNGVGRYKDAATTVNKSVANQYYFSPATYNKIDKNSKYYIVKRSSINRIIDKLSEFVNKKNISGVSLSSLGNTSYSGYPDNSAYNKYGFSDYVNNAFYELKKSNKKIMTYSSNDYAAVLSDCIIGSATKSSQNDGFDKDIPFYQIVMKGITPTAVSSINLAINPQSQFLKALETGTSLSFTLCDEWEKDFSDSNSSIFQFALYETWRDTVVEMINNSKDFLNNVKNSYIIEHSEIAENLYCTEFSNGSVIYVNYSNDAVDSPIGRIGSLDYAYVLAGGK